MMMKRAVSFALVGVLGTLTAVLAGCPIYPQDRDHRVCIGDECYACPDAYYAAGSCASWFCDDSADCPTGYACQDRRCRLDGTAPPPQAGSCTKPSDCPAGTTCGADLRCHTGDCVSSGCPASFVCKLTAGVAACVPVGAGGAKSTCASDSECATPPGSKCLSGQCVAPADQCADGTQCRGGAQCVAGVCTPTCSATQPCPTGYACDTAKGVCSASAPSCGTSADCQGGAVCVEQRCVAPCDAGGACAAPLVCVDGGCIADEKPAFACTTDGVQAECRTGSICLRHSCYIACDADAGAEACRSADKFNVCKAVTTSSGAHSVCGSNDNLGSDCDPTQGRACAGALVCIDGFCR